MGMACELKETLVQVLQCHNVTPTTSEGIDDDQFMRELKWLDRDSRRWKALGAFMLVGFMQWVICYPLVALFTVNMLICAAYCLPAICTAAGMCMLLKSAMPARGIWRGLGIAYIAGGVGTLAPMLIGYILETTPTAALLAGWIIGALAYPFIAFCATMRWDPFPKA